MRFAGGFSPDGYGQGLGAERQPRAKLGAGTGKSVDMDYVNTPGLDSGDSGDMAKIGFIQAGIAEVVLT